MQGVIGTLAEENQRIRAFVGAPTQTCIVVTNAQLVALNLPDRIHSDMCADITQYFESIPVLDGDVDSLPAALSCAVGLAFSHTSRVRGKKQVLAVQLTDGTHRSVGTPLEVYVGGTALQTAPAHTPMATSFICERLR